ncbi:MAG: cytochrome c biogenesis protein CcdA [Actinomycetota bacterium]|nr:cytochrome c biogenesis protein CcdA [Actinomycetota bacterium]
MLQIGIFSAFLAGILAFVSPCVLPLVPVYISLMSNKAIYKSSQIKMSERLYLFINSLLFVAGFSLIFILLGSTATFVGRLLSQYSSIIARVGGVFLIIFGLHYMGVFKLRFLNIEKRFEMPTSLKSGYLSSFLIGLVFSFGWVPCVGLILSGILLLASQMDTLLQGIGLLAAFSVGLGLPFVLASIFIGFFSRLLKKLNRHLNIVSIISGIFLIILGIIFVADAMILVMGWFTRLFPFLNKINI